LADEKLDWNAKIKEAKEGCKTKCGESAKHEFEEHAKGMIATKWAKNEHKVVAEIVKHETMV